MEKERAIVKYNGGLGCILCSKCRKILKIGREFTPLELQYIRGELEYDLPPQYCEKCNNELLEEHPTT
jgi:hypothetical protein